jgi:hypothetical protein
LSKAIGRPIRVQDFRFKAFACSSLLVLGLASASACSKGFEINRWASLKCGSLLPHAEATDRLIIRGVEVERGALRVYSTSDGCILSMHPFYASHVYCEDGRKVTMADNECIWMGLTPRGTFVCGSTHASEQGNVAVLQEWGASAAPPKRRTAALPKPGENCDFLVPDGY